MAEIYTGTIWMTDPENLHRVRPVHAKVVHAKEHQREIAERDRKIKDLLITLEAIEEYASDRSPIIYQTAHQALKRSNEEDNNG